MCGLFSVPNLFLFTMISSSLYFPENDVISFFFVAESNSTVTLYHVSFVCSLLLAI